MGFLKNLYFDFSLFRKIFFFLPRKKPKKKIEKVEEEKKPDMSDYKELPSVSRSVLEGRKEKPKKEKKEPDVPEDLPKITKKVEKKQEMPTERKVIKQPPKIAEHKSARTAPTKEEIKEKAVEEKKSGRYTHDSFFSNLMDHFDEEEKIIHERDVSKDKVFSNLFDEMKTFWDGKKTLLKKEIENKEIENELRKRIQDLHEKEIEWQALKLDHERIEDELYRKEMVIETKIKEFKKIYAKLIYEVDVPDDKAFVLENGQKIKSLKGLIDALLEIDDQTYSIHVNDYKNDFANWIDHVIGMKDLADDLRSGQSKTDIISKLQSFNANS